MTKLGFFFIATIMVSSGAKANPCDTVLAELNAVTSLSALTDTYLKLLKILVEEKNIFSTEELEQLAAQLNVVNPLKIVNVSLSPADKHNFDHAFEIVLQKRKEVELNAIRTYLADVVAKRIVGDVLGQSAKIDTTEVYFPVVKAQVTYGVGAWGTAVNHFVLPDKRLLVLTKAVPADLILHVLDSKSRAVTQTTFSDVKEASYLKSKSGENLIATWTYLGHLSLHRLEDDQKTTELHHPFYVVAGDSSLVAMGENSLGHPFAVLAERRDTGNYNGEQVKRIENYIEVDLITEKRRDISVRNSPFTIHSFVSGDGHVMELEIKLGKLVLRDLTLGTPAQGISRPLDVGPDLSQVFAPTAAEVYMPYDNVSTGQAMWFDFKAGKLIDLSSNALAPARPLLLIPYSGGYHVGSRHFISIVLGDGRVMNHFEKPTWSFLNNEIHYLKKRDGKSFLIIGQEKKRTAPPVPLDVIELDTGVLHEVEFREEINAHLVDVFENETGAIEGLFETERGFKVIQIYGPLSRGGLP